MSSEQTRKFVRYAAQRSMSNEVKAAISKLGADPHGASQPRNNVRLPDGRVMAHVASQTIGNIRDARNLFQVLPDMDYARQILISATISPGDLTDSKVLYGLQDTTLDSSLVGPLIRNAQEFFDNSYRIRTLLHPMLNDIMFETGSYPLLILPEASIDRIINAENYSGVSLESAVVTLDSHLREETDGRGHYKPWGVLGNPDSSKPSNLKQGVMGDGQVGVSFESLMGMDNYVHSIAAPSISVSLESFVPDVEENRELRVKLSDLGKTAKASVESKGSTIDVTDNLSILKRPMVLETRRKLAVRRIYGGKLHGRASLESRAERGDDDAKRTLSAIEKSMYSKRRYKHVPVQPIMTHKQTGTETYGHPLVMHLPSEAVIPVHVPGNPAEHVGYYVMLDIEGNPISIADKMSYMEDIRAQMNNVDSQASQLIQQARRGFEGLGDINDEIIMEMSKVYSETVEDDLLQRLKNGALSGNYELGKTDNVNRLMLARHLKGQRTVMLYVPSEMMVYAAFDYNEFGVGKSLLEDGKILGAIRASIMLANTLATINNAVGGKTIEITLDPDDEDPASTVEFMLSEHAKVNSQGFSRLLGSTHPLGLADQIQNHGVNVVVSGNTRYPETKFDVTSREGTSRQIDADFEETMRRRHIQMFGLSPEIMEGINQTDFATTVVQNNLMLLKRVIQNQEKFEPFLTDFVRRYMLNSGIFLDDMRGLIKENVANLPEYISKDSSLASEEDKVEAFLFDFINNLTVTLPSPEVGDIKKAMESFDSYSEALDKVIDAYINEEMFAADYALGMEEMIPNIKAVTKAEFQRRWLRKYNVMSELDIFNTMQEEEGSPAFDLMEAASEHLDGINSAVSGYVKQLLKAANKRAKTLQKIADEKAKLQAEKDTVSSGGTDDTGGEEGLDSGSDDASLDGEGGSDDLSLDDGAEGGDDLNLDDGGEGTDDLGLDEGSDAELDSTTEGEEGSGENEELGLDEGGDAEASSVDAELDVDAEETTEGTDEGLDIEEEPVEVEEGAETETSDSEPELEGEVTEPAEAESEAEPSETAEQEEELEIQEAAAEGTEGTDSELDLEQAPESEEPELDVPESTEPEELTEGEETTDTENDLDLETEPVTEEGEEVTEPETPAEETEPTGDKGSVEFDDIAAAAVENGEVEDTEPDSGVTGNKTSKSDIINRALNKPVGDEEETTTDETEAEVEEQEEETQPVTDTQTEAEVDEGTDSEPSTEPTEEEGNKKDKDEEEEDEDDLDIPEPPKV